MDKGYTQLLETYRKMFGMVDAFHFNSQNTAEVYEKYLNVPKASKVVPITHGGILDHRKIRTFDSKVLRLGFIGSEAPYKGLPLLKEAIGRLNQEGYFEKIKLSVYGGKTSTDEDLTNVSYKGKFNGSIMKKVYDSMDLLVVPSICNETFSLVTLEALSYGVPVLVSSKVGAKDVVEEYVHQFVYKTKDELYTMLKRLIIDRSNLIQYNKAICSQPWIWSMEQHAKDIVEQIYR